MQAKTLTIRSIKRARNRANPSIPGNLLINSTGDAIKDQLCWFSGREWSNNIISADLPRELPIAAFMGARITYDVLDITQELLDANPAGYKITIGGREIIYKKVGVHNVNLNIDWSTVNFTENTVNMVRIKALFPSNVLAPRPVAPAAQPETIEEPAGVDGGTLANPNEALKILTEEEIAAKEAQGIEEPVDLNA